MRRATALALPILLAAAVVLLLLNLADPQDGGDAEPLPPASESTGRRAGQAAHDPSPTVPTLQGHHAPAPAPAGRSDASSGVPLTPLTAAWVEVTLDRPSGWALHQGIVYALPAGSEGADDLSEVAHAWLADASPGPLRIPLPEAGRWDVGFRGPHGRAMAFDVEVSSGEVVPVRLGFPGYQPVYVRLRDPPPSGMPTGSVIRVELREVESRTQRAREIPGRHESWGGGGAAIFRAVGTRSTPSLPPGSELSIRAYAAPPSTAPPSAPGARAVAKPRTRYVARPEVVRAGETVEVIRQLGGVLDLRLQYDGAFPATWRNWGGRIHFMAQVAGGGVHGQGVWIGPGRDPPMPARVVVHTEPGRVQLQWSGWGILPGALDPFEVGSGEVIRRDVVVRIDQAYDPFRPSDQPVEETPIRLHVLGMPADMRGEMIAFGLGRDDNGRGETVRDGLDGDGPDHEVWGREWRRVQTIQVYAGLDWASRPTSLSAWGATEIRMEEAGLVQVAPAVLAPPGLGAVTLRRQDGLPLASGHFEDEELELSGSVGRIAPGHAGTILGPLPPGEHVFEVWVGSRKRSTKRVQVVAGRIAVLRILE